MLLLSSGFTAKFGLVFVLTKENAFSETFHFKANRKSIGSSKKWCYGFSKWPSVWEAGMVFMWQSLKTLNIFNIFTLKQILWKTKNVFKKLEYDLLVESSKIKNASFPYKTVISEADVTTNKIVSTKWTYRKKQTFASNYFVFLKIFFHFRNLL